MAIGLKITENIRVDLGEIREKLISDLDLNGIAYDIPFDKINKSNIKETILHIKELSIEISIENDIIVYIKSGNTEFSNLSIIEDISCDVLEHIKSIKQHIQNMFDIVDYNVKIEKIDTKTMNITIILSSQNEKARINILRNNLGNVYINTIRAI